VDHSHHDGTEIRPSMPLTAYKTGYSVKRVKRVVARLRDEGILLLQRPATYRIAWSKATPKELYVPPKEPDWYGPGEDKMSPEPSNKDDIDMSPEPSSKEEKESTKEKEERGS
jgi:hypothetical protein